MTYAHPPPTNPSVEKCEDCRSLKPLGARYHATRLLRAAVDDPKWPECKHGRKYLTKCDGRECPPRCCWGDET